MEERYEQFSVLLQPLTYGESVDDTIYQVYSGCTPCDPVAFGVG